MARAWAEVSLDAVRHNVSALRELVAPAEVCAVVKADGYGHGAAAVAGAAVDAGATWLGVAQVPEASALRAAGVAGRILLLSEPRPVEVGEALDGDLHITVYQPELIRELAAAAAARGPRRVPVHLKVDTGMRRVGVAAQHVVAVATQIVQSPSLELASVWTHCALADEPDNPFTAVQLARYDEALHDVKAAGIEVPLRHAANSAAAIAHPSTRYDLVRCGIAIYGIPPSSDLAASLPLEQAVRLVTEISFVKDVPAGEGVSYGHRQRTTRATRVATLPIGYADGVFRSLPLLGQEVLIGGRRRPMLGVATMDQVMVDLGPDSTEGPGDEAVLLGAQGDEHITPDEWAARMGTISYEVVCALGARIERRYCA